MNRGRTLALAVAAVFLVGAAAAVALAGSGRTESGTIVAAVALAAVLAGLWQLYQARRLNREAGSESAADAEGEPLAPERTPVERPLSGRRLATLTSEAADHARREGSLGAGVEVVRPLLRETLGRVLVADGLDREEVEQVLAAGEWTDDRIAAAMTDPNVEPPERSFRERVRSWLFPDRVLREYTRRTVAEIGAVADERLPPVPGADAPRPVPPRQTPVERLTRSLDGAVQEAADPFEAAGDGRQQPPSQADVRAIHERAGLLEEETP